MAGSMAVTLKKPGFLLGVESIEIVIDDDQRFSMDFGDQKEFELDSGAHTVQAVLHAILNRRSRKLKLIIRDGEKANIEGKYSRLWGNINLKQHQPST